VKDPAGLGELLKARCEAYEGYWQQSTYVCNRKTVCAPGTFVNSTLLQPLADRTCHPCAQGQFSEGVNSKECRPFSVYVSRAVLSYSHGGRLDSISPAHLHVHPHVGPQYVQMSWQMS